MDNPKLVAKFILDQEGKPKIIERNGKRHYYLHLGVEAPPPGTYAVTYKLDESYYNPIRESRDIDKNFSEELTSFGDYQIQADIRTKERVEPILANLSQALYRSYQEELTPDIEAAIQDIEKH